MPQKISGEIVGQTPPGVFAHALPLLLWLPPHCDNHSEGIFKNPVRKEGNSVTIRRRPYGVRDFAGGRLFGKKGFFCTATRSFRHYFRVLV